MRRDRKAGKVVPIRTKRDISVSPVRFGTVETRAGERTLAVFSESGTLFPGIQVNGSKMKAIYRGAFVHAYLLARVRLDHTTEVAAKGAHDIAYRTAGYSAEDPENARRMRNKNKKAIEPIIPWCEQFSKVLSRQKRWSMFSGPRPRGSHDRAIGRAATAWSFNDRAGAKALMLEEKLKLELWLRSQKRKRDQRKEQMRRRGNVARVLITANDH